ncbi:MAG: PQQ-binding-like beta-propeller repeat protein [Vicinamibacterales bacterium]
MNMHGLRRTAAAFLTMAGMAAPGSAQNITDADLAKGLADPTKWLVVSGTYDGQRLSPLTQITPANVGQLAPQWTFQAGVTGQFEATPVVLNGILYVSGPQNHAWAIDGKTGKQIWHYQRLLPAGLKVCCGPVNRGFAIYGNKLFMTTLDAHLLALNPADGKVLWDVELADFKLGYASTVAPLVVKGKLIVGMAGGEYANRGFLDAYEPETGKRIWRFWTIPAPGEPGSETWPVDVLERGGSPTWVTGTYRRRAQYDLLGHGQSESRLGWRQPSWRQSLRRVRRRARSRHRQVEVAFPVHAARHARLGREPDAGARRSHGSMGSRARFSCRRTAMASSTCWIVRTGSSSTRGGTATRTGRRASRLLAARLRFRAHADGRRH